jgi:hypothetical protein
MKLFKQLQSFSKKVGFNSEQDREDFIMYAIEKRLEGSNGCFENLYVDYLRHSMGRAEHVRIARRTLPLKNIPANEQHGLIEFDDLLNDLGAVKTARAILVLRHLWGFSNSELAYAFGVSQVTIFRWVSSCLHIQDDHPRIQEALQHD